MSDMDNRSDEELFDENDESDDEKDYFEMERQMRRE